MPAPSTIQRSDPWRPALLAGVLAVVVPVVVGVGVVAATTQSLGPDALRGGTRAWLVAIGSSIQVDGATVSVVPLGASAMVALVAGLLAAVTAREGVEDPVAFGAISGGVAGALAAVLSALTSTASVSTSFVRSAFGAFIVVGLGTAWAMARRASSRTLPAWLDPVLPAVRAGIAAAVVVVAIAFGLVMTLAATRVQAAADLWAALDPGYGGGAVLAMLCVLALPTVVAWTVAVMLGPGIALGADTRVDVTGVDVAMLPAFPPLAILPDPGPFADVAVVVMAVPVLAAAWSGWRLAGRLTSSRLRDRLAHGALAGTVAGLLLALFALSARGSIGPGLLAEAGPPIGSTVLIAIGSMAVGGALGALASHYRGGRADPP